MIISSLRAFSLNYTSVLLDKKERDYDQKQGKLAKRSKKSEKMLVIV